MSLDKILDQPVNGWMIGDGPAADIVLSSRIRLARNLGTVPFPHQAKAEQLSGVVEAVRTVAGDLNKGRKEKFLLIDLEKLSVLERYVLVEKHLISPQHAQEARHRALLIREDAAVSVMINEEDHLRIQCLFPGLELNKAWELAGEVDDQIEARQDYAFSERWGYLTSCPTNVGTGMRASVMMHLPALVLTNQMGRILSAISQLGLAVRGLYGEGTEATGNIFQVSNQLTLGFAEQEIIDNLESVARQIIDQERTTRQRLQAELGDQLTDRVWRAYGILSHARSISSQEALGLLSDVRLGIDLGIIPGIPPQTFNELLVTTRPNYLQKLANRDLDAAARDMIRAEIIREKLQPGKKQ